MLRDRQDCSKIPNAKASGCSYGKCHVFSCVEGYDVSPGWDSCVERVDHGAGMSVEMSGEAQVVIELSQGI